MVTRINPLHVDREIARAACFERPIHARHGDM
jgi:acyl dehydratase